MAGHSKKHMRTRYNPYMSKASRKKKLMMRLIVVGRWDLSEREGAGGVPIYTVRYWITRFCSFCVRDSVEGIAVWRAWGVCRGMQWCRIVIMECFTMMNERACIRAGGHCMATHRSLTMLTCEVGSCMLFSEENYALLDGTRINGDGHAFILWTEMQRLRVPFVSTTELTTDTPSTTEVAMCLNGWPHIACMHGVPARGDLSMPLVTTNATEPEPQLRARRKLDKKAREGRTTHATECFFPRGRRWPKKLLSCRRK